MYTNAARKYQQVQAATLTPGELLVALYDGMFRFLRGASLCFENRQATRARELLSRCHAILSELYVALDHEQAPELCAQLESVYGYCMDTVVQASLKGDVRLIADVIRALTPLREAWTEAVQQAPGRAPVSGIVPR